MYIYTHTYIYIYYIYIYITQEICEGECGGTGPRGLVRQELIIITAYQ